MDTNLSIAIVAASAAMITGISGMWINNTGTGKSMDLLGKRFDDLSFHLGKRMDDMGKRIDEVRTEMKELREEFHGFKEVVNGKFRDLDSEIGKLLDRPK